MSPTAALRNELLDRLAGKRPTRVIVIEIFGCGHARAFNTIVDSAGQARCAACVRLNWRVRNWRRRERKAA